MRFYRFLLILFVLIVIFFALGYEYINKSKKTMNVSMYWKKSYKELDPANISYINEAILIDNMYRNLITYDSYGNLVTDLAESFYWNGKSYVFHFSGKKSSNDIVITAEDVLLSIKRLVLLEIRGNKSERLKGYLCGEVIFKSIFDVCPGLIIKNNMLYVTPTNRISRDLLLNLFTGIDFKILQKDTFLQHEPYKIIDYSNTTGAYYIRSDSDEMEPTFILNKNFEEATYKSPKIWKIISSELREKIVRVKEDLDLITTASLVDWASDGNNLKSYNIFKTIPIALELLVFTKKGQSQLDIKERAYIGKKFREYLFDKVEINKQITYQLFPSDSVGYISETLEEEVVSILNIQNIPKRVVRIGVPRNILKELNKLKQLEDHKIQLIEYEFSDFSINSSLIDAMYVLTDTSVQEELTLMEYNFRFGIFGTDVSESSRWLESYVKLPRAERIKKLRKFHFEVLSSLYVIPLHAMSYYAVTNKQWRFKMSDQSPSTKIWKIEKNLNWLY